MNEKYDLVEKLRSLYFADEALLEEVADHIEQLEAKLAKAVKALQWFIDNDDTNEGDEPMPHRNGMTWNEINAYWIEGLNNGRATLAELKGL